MKMITIFNGWNCQIYYDLIALRAALMHTIDWIEARMMEKLGNAWSISGVVAQFYFGKVGASKPYVLSNLFAVLLTERYDLSNCYGSVDGAARTVRSVLAKVNGQIMARKERGEFDE